MPTLIKNRGNAWLARVIVNYVQVDSRIFPPGKKGGPEWRAAKQWEEERKKEYLAGLETLSAFERLKKWLREYMADSRRKDSKQTVKEKERVLCAFSQFCVDNGIDAIEKITTSVIRDFLAPICDSRGPGVANKHLKNLKTAWTWGTEEMTDGFPLGKPPFRKGHKFDVEEKDRYVPPAEDVIKVLEQAQGQDRVMLLTFYYTGARASEVFRLKWSDIDFKAGIMRLTDKKGGNGKKNRARNHQMHPELVAALRWWKDARPCKVDNVFMQIQSKASLGQPFTHRSHYLVTICKRLGIKPFGFHSMRHKSAEVIYVAKGLNEAQKLMGHSRATTTDRYVRSAGLYTGQEEIVEALGESEIGRAISALLEKEMPHERQTHEAFCKPDHVNPMIQ